MNEDQYDDEIEEMNPDEMLPHDEIRLFPKRIIYRDDEKIEIFESILEMGINFIKKYPGTVDMCIEGISDVLFYYFALMKDEHFEHEHELRFLHYFNKDNRRIHFRKRNGILLRRTTFNFIISYSITIYQPKNPLPIFSFIPNFYMEFQIFSLYQQDIRTRTFPKNILHCPQHILSDCLVQQQYPQSEKPYVVCNPHLKSSF